MMSCTIRIIYFITLISCVNHDYNSSSPKAALSAACKLCGKSLSEMEWFKTLLQQSQDDYALRGDIYAVPIDGSIIFIHQPVIMSCLACVLYDCDGNKLAFSTIDPEKLRLGMKAPYRIYSPN